MIHNPVICFATTLRDSAKLYRLQWRSKPFSLRVKGTPLSLIFWGVQVKIGSKRNLVLDSKVTAFLINKTYCIRTSYPHLFFGNLFFWVLSSTLKTSAKILNLQSFSIRQSKLKMTKTALGVLTKFQLKKLQRQFLFPWFYKGFSPYRSGT